MGALDYETAVRLFKKLKETEYIEPWMYSEGDVISGRPNEYKKVSKDRYNRMKNAVILLYKPGTIPVETKTERDTYFEIKIEDGKYLLYCGDHLKNYLINNTRFKIPHHYNEEWSLKHEFIFEDKWLVEVVSQQLIDKYKEILSFS